VRPIVKYLFLVCLVLCLQSCSPGTTDEPLPNVVFIMADDMGWGGVEAAALRLTPEQRRSAVIVAAIPA